MSENDLLEQRTKKIVQALKKNYSYVTYAILAVIVFISIRIRTANLAGLRDVTTGGWTLGPDLDPFLFLRWGKYIVTHGSLMTMDTLRYIPLGFNTLGELVGIPYLIAWFHPIASMFGSTSVEQSAALLPVPLFALTVVAFFFMTRLVFMDLGKAKSNAIALISSLFLSILPTLLPRTIAGIPEKEAAAFLFLFLTFYLFLRSWKSSKMSSWLTCSILAGISTAFMAVVWGGYNYIFVILGAFMFVAIILGKVKEKETYIYGIWFVSAIILMAQLSTRYSIIGMLKSTITGGAALVLVMAIMYVIVFRFPELKGKLQNSFLKKIPLEIKIVVLAVLIVFILAIVILGPSFIFGKITEIQRILFTPIVDRLGVTVAENRQPFLDEWSSSFGPSVADFFRFISFGNIQQNSLSFLSTMYIVFWMFVIGGIWMFYSYLSMLKKRDRVFITVAFAAFLFGIIYNRTSASSIFNGESFLSTFIYLGGMLFFVGTLAYYYYKYHQENKVELIHSVKPTLIFMVIFLFVSLLSARGAVRLIMVLVPIASMLTGYTMVKLYYLYTTSAKKSTARTTFVVIFAVVAAMTVFAAYYFYAVSYSTAQSYVPSSYTQQWQKAMGWVRNNTNENAVFAHWWDYGYWVQSIGERATVLDGGNYIPYWNHLMGRYALTGSDESEALMFLYTHNVTHLLIDSTDIGKYPAFASIGSNQSYDRRSWIQSFVLDPQQTTETKNTTAFLYRGQSILDEDIYYNVNGTSIILPGVGDRDMDTLQNVAALAAVRLDVSNNGTKIMQPLGYFVYQNKQYVLPLRYAYFNGTLHDFKTGIEAGVFLMTSADIQGGTQVSLNDKGALLYLSRRTIHSQLARLYLFEEQDPYFKVAHVEDGYIVGALKNAGVPVGHFVYYQGVQGPITIWAVSYPSSIKSNPQYLESDFPKEELTEIPA